MKTPLFASLLVAAPLAIQPSLAQEALTDPFGGPIASKADSGHHPTPQSGRTPTTQPDTSLPTPDGAPHSPVMPRTSWPTPLADNPATDGERLLDPPARPYPGDQAKDRVFYDERQGKVWTLGSNFKALADDEGFTFIPFLGSDAPQNYPVRFALESVTLGGAELDLGQEPEVTRDGDRIIIERGSVNVWYDVDWKQIEQSFALKVDPAPQTLSVNLSVDTELAMAEIAGGVRFHNERGGVDYTHALVYDGAGQRLELPILASPGSIELRVPASFMANAVAPVVVDPILATYQVDPTNTRDVIRPDVAFDNTNNAFGYMHVSIWSATDRDIRVETYDGFNDTFLNENWVDFTSADWFDGAIANDNATDTFLVVGLVSDGAGFNEVVGRSLAADDLALSPEVLIGNTATTGTTWTNVALDVGGQYNSSSLFQVIWEREFATLGYSAIRTSFVTPTNPHSTGTAPTAGITYAVEGGSTLSCHRPKVSKSTGSATNAEWRSVWIAEDTATGEQSIHGRRYSDSGTALVSAGILGSPISSAFTLNSLDISDGLSTLSGPFSGAPVYCMPVYYSGSNGADVWLYALEEENLYGERLLTDIEHQAPGLDQAFPSVSSLSNRFNVIYHEFSSGTYYTNVSAIDYTNQHQFGVNERRDLAVVTGTTFSGNAPGCSSRASGGFVTSRYTGTAAEQWTGSEWLMFAARSTAAASQTTGRQYCVGFPNTTGDYGFITMFGAPDTTNLKLVQAEALPLNQFAYFLAGQGGFGTVQPPGSAGLLCLIGGGIGRYNLGVEIQFTGTSGIISLDIDPSALRGPSGDVVATSGTTWNFQAWHREDGGNSNFTNAISVVFD